MKGAIMNLHDVIDDRLLQAYWDSVDHFGTTDLVLIFEVGNETNPVCALVRETLLANPSTPETLRFTESARDAGTSLKGSTAFWLVVLNDNGESFSMAVNAQALGKAGSA